MLERDDGISIPTPPGAVLLGFCALTDRCLGVVTGWFDRRDRVLPDGSSVARRVRCFDGRYLAQHHPRLVRVRWFFGAVS